MATPFENGQRQVIQHLERWEELGWDSMQAAATAFGTEALEELEAAQERGNEKHIEYFKGRLSRLD